MPIIHAKCPNCYNDIDVDTIKEADICPHCNSAYVVDHVIKKSNLVMCPVCQNYISKNALSCPHCGEPTMTLHSEDHRPKFPVVILIVTVLFSITKWFLMISPAFSGAINAFLSERAILIWGIYTAFSVICCWFSIYTISSKYSARGLSIVSLVLSIINTIAGAIHIIGPLMKLQ